MAATIANVAPRKGRPLRPIDFMPFAERARQTARQMLHAFRGLIAGTK